MKRLHTFMLMQFACKRGNYSQERWKQVPGWTILNLFCPFSLLPPSHIVLSWFSFDCICGYKGRFHNGKKREKVGFGTILGSFLVSTKMFPFWMVLWLVGVGIIYNNRKISSVFLTRQGFCHCLFLNCLKSCFKQLGIKKDTIDLAKSQRWNIHTYDIRWTWNAHCTFVKWKETSKESALCT